MKRNIAENDPTIGWCVKSVSRALMVFSALMPWGATADWINLTGAETAPNIAEIYVLDDRVKLVFEVYIGDLDVFADLVPDDWLRDGSQGRPGLEERMRRFSAEKFQFVTETGEKLQGRLVTAEPRLRDVAQECIPRF